MRISRIYLPIESDHVASEITIEGDKAHYIRNVLRLKPNQLLHFFIINGNQYQAKVQKISKHTVDLTAIELTQSQPKKSVLTSTIAQGISSSDRMDYSIQKSAELGCQHIIPFISDFCSQKIPAHKYDKKWQHWQGVAVSACEQSGRSDIMTVAPIITLAKLTQNLTDGIYLEPTAVTTLGDLPQKLQLKHTFLIGPEGGFSPDEIDAFVQAKLTGIRLGHRVLRTETVAPVILSAMHALYGDFKQLVE